MATVKSIPTGYVWVRDVYPDAVWNNKDRSISLPNGRTLKPDVDYVTYGDKSYFKPVSQGNMSLSSLVPGATKNLSGGYDLPGVGSLTKNQYELDANKQPYVNPSVISSMYANKVNQPMNEQTYQGYADIATKMFEPTYKTQSDALSRLIQSLSDKLTARMAAIDADASRATMNLQDKQRRDSEALARQSIGRGTYTSGVSDYEQRQLSNDYAPQFGQLEREVNAQKSEANTALGSSLQEIAAKQAELESGYLTNVSNTALGLYKDENTRNQQAFENVLKLIGVSDERIAAIKKQALDQATAESNIFGKINTQGSADVLGTNVGAQTVTGQSMDMQKEAAAISAAISRVQAFGKVTTEADAKILGVPVNTPSNDAIQAGLNRAQQLKIAQMSAGGSGGSSLGEDLKMWELAGKAPDTPALRKYGIAPGTPWTGTAADQAQALKDKQTLEDAATEQQFQNSVQTYKKTYGVDDGTAEAIAVLFTNPDRASALAKMNANLDQLKAEGVNIPALQKALNIRYPDVKAAIMPSRKDYTTYIKGDLTTDYMTMANYQNEISAWLNDVQKYAANNDPVAIDALNYFYNNFPNGTGDLAKKLQFVKARANNYHSTSIN